MLSVEVNPESPDAFCITFVNWQSFTLTMDDYRFIRWAASHNTHQHAEHVAFDAAAKKLAESGWESLVEEERAIFADHQLSQGGSEDLQEGCQLEGWGRLEGGVGREEIRAFSEKNDPGA